MEYQRRPNILSKYRKPLKLEAITKQKADDPKPDTKRLFFFDSTDHFIKKLLLDRDWHLAPSQSKNLSLRWICMPKNNTFAEVGPEQKVNHFPHSHILTSKLGLKKTLQCDKSALVSFEGKSQSSFFPRSYDLSEQLDYFVKEFKRTALVNLLKKIMIAIEIEAKAIYIKLSQQVLQKSDSLNLLKRFKELLDEDGLWETNEKIIKSHNFRINSKIFESILCYFCISLDLDTNLTEDNFARQQFQELVAFSQINPPYQHFDQESADNERLPSASALRIFFQVYKLCFKKYCWFKADGLRNIWVIKSSDSSRGRSVFLADSLQDIKFYNNGMRMVQKYIENVWICNQDQYTKEEIKTYPFIKKLNNKKFDVRIWVLATSFSPLEAYIYEEGYLRISQEEYQLINIEREKTHLTNFSVNWKTSHLDNENSYVLLSDFLRFLNDQGIKKRQTFQKQIRNIVLHTLQSADLMVNTTDYRCFELYGFDIIFDCQLKPWLLECNMSPACKERGKLAAVIEEMSEGLLSIVGLIQKCPSRQKWQKLQIFQERARIRKKVLSNVRKQNKNLYKSQCFIHAKMVKKYLKSIQQCEAANQQHWRGMSFFPALSNQSLHKPSFPLANSLTISGAHVNNKDISKMDTVISLVQSTIFIQRFYRIRLKHKRSHSRVNKWPTLRCLKLIQVLTKLAKERVRKTVIKLKKMAKKHKSNY